MNSYTFKLTVFLICATEASCAECISEVNAQMSINICKKLINFHEKFIAQPHNATVMKEESITIPCVFNEKVDFCRWYRNPGILIRSCNPSTKCLCFAMKQHFTKMRIQRSNLQMCMVPQWHIRQNHISL